MSKHTPGPWKAGGIFIMSGDRYIGTVDSCETAPRQRRKSCPSLNQAYKNANLIAASPELLAVLERIAAVDDNRDITPTRDEMKRWAREAIAKAKL